MGTFYDAPNDYRNYLAHHGVKGMKWGQRKEYIPHPRAGGANPSTPMSSLGGGQSLADKIKKRKQQKKIDQFNKGMERARKKAANNKANGSKQESDYFTKRNSLQDYFNKVNKFDTDKKFRNQVRDYTIAKLKKDKNNAGSPWINPKSWEIYTDPNITDTFVADYLRATDDQFNALERDFGDAARSYHKKRYGMTFGNY